MTKEEQRNQLVSIGYMVVGFFDACPKEVSDRADSIKEALWAILDEGVIDE